MQFFLYYGNDFDFYRDAVSVRNKDGRPISKKENAEWWTTPCLPVVEDPLFPSNNVIRTTFRVNEIKQTFYDAYACLKIKTSGRYTPTMVNNEPFLANIIFINDDFISYRQYIQNVFSVPKPSSSECPAKEQTHPRQKQIQQQESSPIYTQKQRGYQPHNFSNPSTPEEQQTKPYERRNKNNSHSDDSNQKPKPQDSQKGNQKKACLVEAC